MITLKVPLFWTHSFRPHLKYIYHMIIKRVVCIDSPKTKQYDIVGSPLCTHHFVCVGFNLILDRPQKSSHEKKLALRPMLDLPREGDGPEFERLAGMQMNKC